MTLSYRYTRKGCPFDKEFRRTHLNPRVSLKYRYTPYGNTATGVADVTSYKGNQCHRYGIYFQPKPGPHISRKWHFCKSIHEWFWAVYPTPMIGFTTIQDCDEVALKYPHMKQGKFGN